MTWEGIITFTVPENMKAPLQRASKAAGYPRVTKYARKLLSDYSGVDLEVNKNATPNNNWRGRIQIEVPKEKREAFQAAVQQEECKTVAAYARHVVFSKAREFYDPPARRRGTQTTVRRQSNVNRSRTDAPGGRRPRKIEQQESDEAIERRLVKRLEQQRNRRKAVELKLRYDNTCMFCGTQLQVAKNRFYSEAAHIRGLGSPDNGPDKKNNMLVLCPNHHIQFDRGVLRLHKVNGHYQIKSETLTDRLHGKKISLKHSIDESHVKHHYRRFE